MSNFYLLHVSRFGDNIPPDPLIYSILGFLIGILLTLLVTKFVYHFSDQSAKKPIKIRYSIILSVLLMLLSFFGFVPSIAAFFPN